MTMKPDSAAFLRNLDDVMVDQKYLPQQVAMPGLNSAWRPLDISVGNALSDIDSLLEQAIGTFDHSNDFTQEQWGALQQLNMAHALLGAVHRMLDSMALAPHEQG